MSARDVRLPILLMALVLVVGCATSGGQPGKTGRTGMDRVSPVRSAEVNTRLGLGYLERGDLQVAIEKLETALKHDPAHVPAMVTLALVNEKIGRESEALKHYRKAHHLAPDDGSTLNSYAAFLCRQGEYAKADELFRQVAGDPFYESAEVALTNAGACASKAGWPEKAEGYLRQALENDAEYPDALYHLAKLLYDQGKAFRARAFLQRLEATGVTGPDTLLLGYQIESRLGNPAQANEYVSVLENRYPKSEEARQLRQQADNND